MMLHNDYKNWILGFKTQHTVKEKKIITKNWKIPWNRRFWAKSSVFFFFFYFFLTRMRRLCCHFKVSYHYLMKGNFKRDLTIRNPLNDTKKQKENLQESLQKNTPKVGIWHGDGLSLNYESAPEARPENNFSLKSLRKIDAHRSFRRKWKTISWNERSYDALYLGGWMA